jgi:ATP-dependent Clp protease ATP-binding subunit ClpC
MVGVGPNGQILPKIPFTPRVKKVFVLATKEAKALHHTYVGTEHLLLGLLREGDGIASRVLQRFHVNYVMAFSGVRSCWPGTYRSCPAVCAI